MGVHGPESSIRAEILIDESPGAGVRWAPVGVGLTGLGLGVLELTMGIPQVDPPDYLLLIHVLVGWAFVGSSLLALTRHPDNSVGQLLAAVGLLWFVPLLTFFDSSIPFSLGFVAEGLFWAPLAQLFLSFPAGRLENRFERGTVVALYILLPLLNFLTAVFIDFETAGCRDCPANMFLVRSSR